MAKQLSVQTPIPPGRTRVAKSNTKAFIFLGVIVVLGLAITILIVFFDIDSKVDVPNYPGSEKASLTAKGTSFVESKYTSDKPTKDYYKIGLTSDSCETVLRYYRTEAGKSGWGIEKQNGSAGTNVVVDSYRKSAKGLFVYCAPGSEQLVQNAGSKNTVIITAADSILDLNPGSQK